MSSQGKAESLASSQGQDDDVDPVHQQYIKQELIGQGSCGMAYKAYNLKTSVVVALKFANIDETCPWVAERDFAILKSLRHDSIVPLCEYFGPTLSRDVAVFVYPLRDSNLREFLECRKADVWMQMPPVDRDIIELWSHQLARGVEYMHSCHLVHRHLKPSNILLKWQVAGLHVEIADLGSSRYIMKTYRMSKKTPPPNDPKTKNVGAECYAAPEVWFEGRYGYPMDIWSFGAIVFEMMTLKRFIESESGRHVEMVVCVLSRLGCQEEAELHVLGPHQSALVKSALEVLAEGTIDGKAFPASLHELVAISKPLWDLWDLISAALMWSPEARIQAETLSQKLSQRLERTAQRDREFDVQRVASPGLGTDAGPRLEHDEAKLRPTKKSKLWMSLSSCSTPPFDINLTTTTLCQTPTTRKGGRCRCAGSCNMPGHRYRAEKCKEKEICTETHLVPGCGLCIGCKCSVPSCPCPKSRDQFCYRHKEMMNKLPWRFHAIRAARHILPSMIPCDITVFVELFGQLKTTGLCSMFLAAWLKEPKAVRAFVGALSGSKCVPPESADDIFNALVKMIHEVDGPSNVIELQQTTRQGVCRFMGVRIVCRKIGVIGTSPQEVGLGANAEVSVVSLGLGAEKFCVAEECPESLRSFVSVCDASASAFRELFHTDVSCDGVVSFANKLYGIMNPVIDKCLPMTSGMKGYTQQNMIRKITVSWLHDALGAIAGQKDVMCWQSFNFQAIEEAGIVADVQGKAQLDIANCYPAGCLKASDISELLLGRVDHALFVSMWACLFSDVEKSRKDDDEAKRLIELLSGPRSAQVLASFIEKHKIPPCPEVLAKLLLRKST